MEKVILVIHLMLAISLVAVILLQRTAADGGGITGGGGGTMGGLFTARGSANVLTRTTAILATAFFITSITLAILAGAHNRSVDIAGAINSGVAVPISGSTPVPGAPTNMPAVPQVPMSK
jgi:preprotein translocase subunit SecG